MQSFEPFTVASDEIEISGFLHRAAERNADALVLTHGAGSDCNAPLLIALADSFSAAGITVLRCNLAFRQRRRNGPPSPATASLDQAGLRRAVLAMKAETAGHIFLGGHSYGGRQASMLAAAEPGLVPALLLLSYPLHPPAKPQQLRTSHFPSLRTPALFVSGSKDDFATPEELQAALRLIPAQTQLMTITGSGHSILSKQNKSSAADSIVAAFCDFVGSKVARS